MIRFEPKPEHTKSDQPKLDQRKPEQAKAEQKPDQTKPEPEPSRLGNPKPARAKSNGKTGAKVPSSAMPPVPENGAPDAGSEGQPAAKAAGKPDVKTSVAPEAIHATMLALAQSRGAEKTICPSDVARALGGDHPDAWGPLMIPVRRVAVKLAQAGDVVIYRKGKPVAPDDFKGVYRIGLPRPAGT